MQVNTYDLAMRIILFFLKCIVGVLATLGFLMVAGIASAWLLLERVDPLRASKDPLPEAMVLTFDLADGLIEVKPDNPLARASLGRATVLRDMLDTLEAAGADPRVKGLFVRLGRGAPGLASVQELRDAVIDFRARGKFAIAFAETFGEAGNGTQHYYLASAFGHVWLQPSGDVGLTGFSLQSPFLRGILDDIGIEPQIGQRGPYKGAAAFVTETALPAPQRANLQRLLDSSLEQVTAGIASARGLSTDTVAHLIDTAPLDAKRALAAGLIDKLGYLDAAEDAALSAAGILDGSRKSFVTLSGYDQRRDVPEPSGETLALIHGLGPVVLDGGENDPIFGRLSMGADTLSAAFRAAAAAPDVKAIVFRVDSPGGSYVASDTIWHEVKRAQDGGVPVIVSMGGVAASGGYFVAAPAQAIVAQPGTITGSIGVITGKMVLAGLWDRLGVKWDGVKAGVRADLWSPNRKFTAAEWTQVQASLDRVYADFTSKVAEGRGMPIEQVLSAAEGRVWTGADALELGLVDALGGYRKAFALAREAAGLDPEAPIQVRVFPKERDPVKAFLEDALGGALEVPGIGALLRGLARLVQVLEPAVSLLEELNSDPRGAELRLRGVEELR